VWDGLNLETVDEAADRMMELVVFGSPRDRETFEKLVEAHPSSVNGRCNKAGCVTWSILGKAIESGRVEEVQVLLEVGKADPHMLHQGKAVAEAEPACGDDRVVADYTAAMEMLNRYTSLL